MRIALTLAIHLLFLVAHFLLVQFIMNQGYPCQRLTILVGFCLFNRNFIVLYMKCCIFFIFLLLTICSKAQIITTVAGGGSGGLGSAATAAHIIDPTWLTFDRQGNYYIVEGTGNEILRIDVATSILTKFAGTGSSGYSGDGGLADTSKLGIIGSCIFDSNYQNLYIADIGNNRILKVNMLTNILSTSAGSGISGFGGDNGAATAAVLQQPNDICFDKFGNTFISDPVNRRIRKINTIGIISTYVGNGIAGTSGDNGPATDAEISNPRGIATDDTGNLYFADQGDVRIRKVNLSGMITTIAGNSSGESFNGDNLPATSAYIGPVRVIIHDRCIYISDFYNNRIRMVDTSGLIHTIAGNGVFASNGDGGSADSAALYGPSGIAFDTCGNLYITEVNGGRIRKVSFNPSCGPLKEKEISEQHINIYPNPATDKLTVDGAKAGTTYRVLNIIGIMEQSGILQTGSNSIPIKDLPPGMKLVEILTPDGAKVVKRVVKE